MGLGCFGCFAPEVDEDLKPSKPDDSSGADARRKVAPDVANGYAHSFTFKDLLVATGYFNEANFIGEGGFGKVYKGKINGQMVAVKQLARDGVQGRNEFLVEVLMLTVLNHRNLVSLVGFCAQGDERLLVYEYMPFGSLESHLFDVPLGKKPLDWNTRVRIVVGVAEGLSYLHNVADPPVIYRDMKAANILLGEDFSPKLSDFGLAKVGPVGDRTHVSTRVMGTYGYCAPDYVVSGKLTMKSDIYSFGVLLLELITGRRIYDASRPKPEQSLLTWSRPFLHDKRKFYRLADPSLLGCYPSSALNQLVVISIMCLQDQPHVRPIISDVVIGLNHVASQPYTSERPPPASMSSPASSGSPQLVSTPSRRRGGDDGVVHGLDVVKGPAADDLVHRTATSWEAPRRCSSPVCCFAAFDMLANFLGPKCWIKQCQKDMDSDVRQLGKILSFLQGCRFLTCDCEQRNETDSGGLFCRSQLNPSDRLLLRGPRDPSTAYPRSEDRRWVPWLGWTPGPGRESDGDREAATILAGFSEGAGWRQCARRNLAGRPASRKRRRAAAVTLLSVADVDVPAPLLNCILSLIPSAGQ
ncbi:unnamed protein product [Miscanthus lutarioriparius]|uniref:non-specific serine/threonine protein kinase n=1 Tax=Miscanthus lutarioriparius TaxID=422564 RepID=A0A811M9V4_9POAL|nr:unnamed protein product [Miscanthus lutarioriparius]